MRIISDAYQHLGALVKAKVLDDDGQPAFNWADMWYEQTEFPELAEAINYPAVFFEFASENITTAGELLQDVTLLTNVYVAVENLQDTHIGGPELVGALHYLELLARVHELLQAHEHPSCGNLNRIGFMPISTRTNLIVYRTTYHSEVMDTSVRDLRRVTEPIAPNAIKLDDKRKAFPIRPQVPNIFDL